MGNMKNSTSKGYQLSYSWTGASGSSSFCLQAFLSESASSSKLEQVCININQAKSDWWLLTGRIEVTGGSTVTLYLYARSSSASQWAIETMSSNAR